MTGWEQNSDPESFLQAPVEEAAERLAEVLREENADVLTVYDWHGNYGHPDHIKVHTVGHRAAELAGIDEGLRVHHEPRPRRADVRGRPCRPVRPIGPDEDDFDPAGPADDGNPFGMPESELTHAVDVSAFVKAKRESLRAHRSQVTDTTFFLEMPDERLHRGVRHRVVHPEGCGAGSSAGVAVRMTRLYLVRHGRAAAGWDTDPDPGLDEIGQRQAVAVAARLAEFGRDAHSDQPIATMPGDRRAVGGDVECRATRSNRLSPRSRRQRGLRWRIGSSGCGWRCAARGPTSALATSHIVTRSSARWPPIEIDAVVFSHFVAINAAIGAATR